MQQLLVTATKTSQTRHHGQEDSLDARLASWPCSQLLRSAASQKPSHSDGLAWLLLGAGSTKSTAARAAVCRLRSWATMRPIALSSRVIGAVVVSWRMASEAALLTAGLLWAGLSTARRLQELLFSIRTWWLGCRCRLTAL